MLQTETKGASAPTKASQSDPTTERPLRTLAPRLDLFDREGAYVMYVDLPGVTAEEVELSWTDGELELDVRCENNPLFGRARFQRRLRLPADAQGGEVEAKLELGVLTVAIPKVKPEVRKIQVKSAS